MSIRLIEPGRRKGNKCWYAVVSAGGVRREVNTRTKDKQKARQFAEALEADLFEEYVFGRIPHKTAGAAIDGYIAWRQPGRYDLRYLAKLRGWFGDTPLRHIGQAEMDEAAQKLYPNCMASTWGRHVYVPMSAVMNYAGVPVRFRKPPQPKPKTRSISRPLAERLIRRAKDRDLKALLAFLFFTGARLSEAMGLRPEDIDIEHRRVRLRLGKRGIDVWRPLHDRALKALQSLPRRRERVFRWRTNSGAQQALHRYRRETGVGLTFHMARHSFATWLANEGANLRDVMDAGGWSSPKTVIRYIGSDDERLRRAISKL